MQRAEEDRKHIVTALLTTMNEGDMDRLALLIQNHVDDECRMETSDVTEAVVGKPAVLTLFSLLCEIFPDGLYRSKKITETLQGESFVITVPYTFNGRNVFNQSVGSLYEEVRACISVDVLGESLNEVRLGRDEYDEKKLESGMNTPVFTQSAVAVETFGEALTQLLEQKTNSSAGNSVRSSVRSGSSIRDSSQPPSGCTTGTNTPSAMQTMLAVQKFNRSSKSGNTTPYGPGHGHGQGSNSSSAAAATAVHMHHASAVTSTANSRKSSFNSVMSPNANAMSVSASINSLNAAAVMAAAASARAAVSAAAFAMAPGSSNDAHDTDTKMVFDNSGVTTRNGSFAATSNLPDTDSFLARSSGTATPNLHVQSFIQRTMPQIASFRLADANMAHLTRMGTTILQKATQIERKQTMALTFNQKNQIVAITVKDV